MSITISARSLQVLNFDENFVVAAKAILLAQGIIDSESIAITQESVQLPQTNVDIEFQLGQATNKGAITSGYIVDDYYDGCQLVFNIRTPREDGLESWATGLITYHNQLCATIRGLMQTHRNAFTDANLPYYGVKFIRPIGTRHYTDDTFTLQDITTLTFVVEFCIYPAAWDE